MNHFRCTVLASLAACGPAAAQVSMIDAIAIAENAVADRLLVQIRLREEETLVWRAAFVDAALKNVAEVDLDVASGDIVDTSFDAIEAGDLAVYQAIFANPEAIAISFAEGVAAAQQASGANESPFGAQLDFEAGILAYQVEFLPNESKYYVDAVTGTVANHHGDDDADDDLIPPENLLAGIDAAVALNALPVLGAKGEDEQGGDDNTASVVEVLQWNAKTGDLVETIVDAATGEVLANISFVPSVNQLARLQPVIDALGSITVTFAEAIDAALAEHPGAPGVHEIELEAEDAGIFYKVELVNTAGIEIDVHIDAVAPGAPVASHAGVNFHPCDHDRDGMVAASDLAELLSVWAMLNPGYDLNGDQVVTGVELGALLVAWH
jgi:uncharacterized membrane protein YkoI